MDAPKPATQFLCLPSDLERLLHVLDDVVFLRSGKHFNTLQTTILRGVWIEQSYQDIAHSARCSETHIKKVGAELWELLSVVLSEPISKRTLRAVLERRSGELLKQSIQSAPAHINFPVIEVDNLEFPDGPVKFTSPFYIDHSAIATRCYQAIQQPGGLVRIKAPSQMGKTTLLNRILFQAKQHDYLCVTIDLQLADRSTLQNLDRFLQWFCANITRSLQLPFQLSEHWNTDFGSKISCQDYFRNVLLPQLRVPLVLAIDKLDLLFAFPEVADDFLGLLRSWYEQGKESELWQKLRLILVHSTKGYAPLNINQSPFNVGLVIELPEFSLAQISTLADRHGLVWTTEDLEKLMTLVGGHPHLIRLALYHIAQNFLSLEQLMRMEFTEANPFYTHLQRHFTILEQNSNLVPVLVSVLMEEPVNVNSPEVLLLYRMGLVRIQHNKVQLRCELYRQWLSDRQSLQLFSNTFSGDENLQILMKKWFMLVQVYRFHLQNADTSSRQQQSVASISNYL